MPRTRYAAADLTPITRDALPTYERESDPGGRRRDETWVAWSTCGIWAYLRSEDTGTPWHVRHLPTGYTTSQTWSRLNDARYTTARADIWALILDDALWFLRIWAEIPGGPAPITPHDEARALLTWLADGGHAPAAPAGTPA